MSVKIYTREQIVKAIRKAQRESQRYGQWIDATAWLTDWMRLFPGYAPRWLIGGHSLDNLAAATKPPFVGTYEYQTWQEREAERKDKLSPEVEAAIEADPSADFNTSWTFLNEHSPKPGGLYRLVKAIEKFAPIDYAESDTEGPYIYFKKIEGIKVGLAGAEGWIRIIVSFGMEEQRSWQQQKVYQGKGLRVHVIDKGGWGGSFHSMIDGKPVEVRRRLKGLLGGRNMFASPLIASRDTSRGFYEAYPAVVSDGPGVVALINRHLCPAQIMPKAAWGKLWEGYQQSKRLYAMDYRLFLVGGLFWLFQAPTVRIGMVFTDASDGIVTFQPYKHPAAQFKLTRDRFKDNLDWHQREMYKEIATRLGLLVNDYHKGRIASADFEGMPTAEVLKKLRVSLHRQALKIFKPGASKCL